MYLAAALGGDRAGPGVIGGEALSASQCSRASSSPADPMTSLSPVLLIQPTH
jgi:hypothetical protein